jgi:hypothetical protein
MKILLYNYVQALIHPFKFHNFLRTERGKKHNLEPLRLAEEDEFLPGALVNLMRLNFVESVGISWIFVILRAFYSFFGLWLGKFILEGMGWGVKGSFDDKKIILIFQVGQVVFFPLMVWLYVKFWSLLIVFFGILYDKEDHSSEIAEEILNTSLCTYAFLAIPIFGGFLQKIVSLVFIFIGLKENMKLGTLQSFLVVLSPIFLTLFLLFMGVTSIMVIFDSL